MILSLLTAVETVPNPIGGPQSDGDRNGRGGLDLQRGVLLPERPGLPRHRAHVRAALARPQAYLQLVVTRVVLLGMGMLLKRHLTLAFWRRLVETRANAERNRVNGHAGWWSQGCPLPCKATNSAAAAASLHLLPAWARSSAGAPTLHVLPFATAFSGTLFWWRSPTLFIFATDSGLALWF